MHKNLVSPHRGVHRHAGRLASVNTLAKPLLEYTP